MDTKADRYEGIDGLKAYAIIGIALMHVLANGEYGIGGFVFERLIPSFTNLVFLFMMVSGFGMCCGYYQKIIDQKISVEDFYKKVGLTSNTEFLSLQEKPDVWAEHVLKYMNVQRKSERKILEQAGYDIQQTADTLGSVIMTVLFGFVAKAIAPSTWVGLIVTACILSILGFGIYFIFVFSNKERKYIINMVKRKANIKQ